MTAALQAPERAEGLELLGALGGSGYRSDAFLVRRSDGQTLQVTPLLHAVLAHLDGSPLDAVARAVSEESGRTVTADDVAFLVSEKLAPLGVLRGTEPAQHATANPLLALRFKVVASDPDTTARLTRPFAWLFTPYVLWPVLAAFVGVCWFVLVDKGLASATHQAFQTPGLLLAVFALTVASAGFHELGHAAACRYGGARPGAMGMGLYLVWPAFYTNVDDSYRLDRRGRLRVDLGGLYFNALVAVVVTALYAVTGVDALLLGVATQLLQMLRQLAPVLRADGYHVLADATGVPDLCAHLGPTVKRLLPWHWRDPSPLTRRARWLVTGWVLVVVPVLASMTLTAVLLFPRLAATAWASGRVRGRQAADAAQAGDLLGLGAAGLQLLALVLPVLGVSYLLARLVRRAGDATWRVTEGRPFWRGAATTAIVLLLAAVLVAWWPSGQYRPVSASERGTLPSLLSAPARPAPVTRGQQTALAMVPRGGATEAHPALLVLQTDDGPTAVITSGDRAGRAFPFALPSAPRPGDNQALAVNGTDGSTVYDVAVALVTLTDGADVRNANTAWALASCTRCTTVAVAFQVVLVVGQSDVVVPVNAAVAANSACISCLTQALAVQLVVTLKDLPSDEVRTKLDAALAQLDATKSLDAQQLYDDLMGVQQQVLTVLTDAGLVDASTTATASASATPSASDAPTSEPTPSGSAAATELPSASPSAPSSDPTPSATPSATPAPTTSATP